MRFFPLVIFIFILSVFTVNAEPIFGQIFGDFSSAIGRGITTSMQMASGVGESFMEGAKTTIRKLQVVARIPFNTNLPDLKQNPTEATASTITTVPSTVSPQLSNSTESHHGDSKP